MAAGAVQGYFGGWTDLLFQRFIEIWQGLPILYLLIILASVVEPNFWWFLGLLLMFRWMGLVGVVRAEFLRARNFDFVKAARALGQSDVHIMWRHVLPNAMVSALTFMPFVLTGSVTLLTSLDFLGFGLPPGSPSLGELLKQGESQPAGALSMRFSAFFTLAVMLSLLVFIGEAVRDAFDPRKTFASTGDHMSLLQIENLGVRFHAEDGGIDAVHSASMEIEKGETVAAGGRIGFRKVRHRAVRFTAFALSPRQPPTRQRALWRRGAAGR